MYVTRNDLEKYYVPPLTSPGEGKAGEEDTRKQTSEYNL